MTVQADLIAQLLSAFPAESERGIARRCGVSQQRLYNYKIGARKMDDDAIVKIAKCLNLQAEKLIPAHHAENSSSPELRRIWKHLAAAAVIVLATGITALPSHAAALLNGHQAMHYAKLARLARFLFGCLRKPWRISHGSPPLLAV